MISATNQSTKRSSANPNPNQKPQYPNRSLPLPYQNEYTTLSLNNVRPPCRSVPASSRRSSVPRRRRRRRRVRNRNRAPPAVARTPRVALRHQVGASSTDAKQG